MNRLIILAAVLLLFAVNLKATKEVLEDGTVYGKVVEGRAHIGLEYVTIAIYRTDDDKLIGGAITTAEGVFKIKGLLPASYYVDVSFVGYKSKRIENVVIEQKNQHVDLGMVIIGEDSGNLEEVEIVAERASIEFKLDKKIVNVSKHYTSISGSAVNVLENVPSVTVDIEGNVALRGSTGFTVLVDGVPSILESSVALQQIPASTIENIEIITNPSAKYNPDGTSGIINVITKKNRMNGLNGVFNVKTGTNNLGGDFLFNLKREKWSYFLGSDYATGNYPGEKKGYRYSYKDNTVFTVEHDGEIRSKYKRYNIRGGLDFRIDTMNSLSIDLSYGDRKSYTYSDLKYTKYDDSNTLLYQYLSDENGFIVDAGISANAIYAHKFNTKGHELIATVSYRDIDSEESNKNVLVDQDRKVTEGRENTELGPMSRWQTKLDYEKPLGEQGNIEAGYQSTFTRSDDITGLLENKDGVGYVEKTPYRNKVQYMQDIYALYFIYANQVSKFGYQLGLRGEYNNRQVAILESGSVNGIGEEKATIDRVDYFPSAHFSYQLPSDQELMASYSRRIERFRSYHFEPFYTWVDAYNIRRGNSDLLPENIDSYEVNYIKKYEKSYLSFETYYRITNHKVEWVRSLFEENVIQRFPKNVGKDYSLGVDATYSFDLMKWWRVDLSGSLYNYKVKGNWDTYSFDEERLTWNYRINQTLKINKLTQLQANWRYYSKRISSQGIYQPVYTLDVALRKEMMDRKLTGVLELRDVFSTNNRENTNEGIDFKDHYYQKIYTPVLTLVLTYRFNNYKPDRRRSAGSDSLGGSESME